jgi:hypothetical protein
MVLRQGRLRSVAPRSHASPGTLPGHPQRRLPSQPMAAVRARCLALTLEEDPDPSPYRGYWLASADLI